MLNQILFGRFCGFSDSLVRYLLALAEGDVDGVVDVDAAVEVLQSLQALGLRAAREVTAVPQHGLEVAVAGVLLVAGVQRRLACRPERQLGLLPHRLGLHRVVACRANYNIRVRAMSFSPALVCIPIPDSVLEE